LQPMILFEDRLDAGEKLANQMLQLKLGLKDPLVIGIPRGGIPVGYSVAQAFSADLDFIVLRKLPIPDNPEAGFGAVTLGKVAIFNRQILARLDLSQAEISSIIDDVYDEVLRRDNVFRRGRPAPNLKDRTVIVTDDGLASGYTMLAAVNYVGKQGAKKIIVAIPVAHENAYALIQKNVDNIIAYHISTKPVFAVASFYRRFPDLSDKEVINYLDKRKNETNRNEHFRH
jgi:putative phosphoribosyl transferase